MEKQTDNRPVSVGKSAFKVDGETVSPSGRGRCTAVPYTTGGLTGTSGIKSWNPSKVWDST